jgi:hypothetical protein
LTGERDDPQWEVAAVLYLALITIVLIIGGRLLLQPEVRLARYQEQHERQPKDRASSAGEWTDGSGQRAGGSGQRAGGGDQRAGGSVQRAGSAGNRVAGGEDRAEPPRTLEGALVHELIRGGISRAQYQAAQARLAEHDDERLPLSIPDEDSPA